MSRILLPFTAIVFLCAATSNAAPPRATQPATPADSAAKGATVEYHLPADGPLPRTYRVTLAVTDPKNPDWLVSTFAAGVVRTVTAENQGKFAETWDGLDDNFMPVPPGDYGVKGIYMPADKWAVDGEYHTVVPKFVTGASSFQPPDELKPEPFHGDPVGSPMGDVAVSPGGVAVFYYQYLENGKNNPMIDLNKPVGYDQFVQSFGSGGAAGGTSTTTDGTTVWSFSTDGGQKFVYRADGKRFGAGKGNSRAGPLLPPRRLGHSHGQLGRPEVEEGLHLRRRAREDRPRARAAEVALGEQGRTRQPGDGARRRDGRGAGRVPVAAPRGLAVGGDALYVLHADGGRFAVSRAAIRQGLPQRRRRSCSTCPMGRTRWA